MELKQKEILDTLILCEYKGDTILLTDDDSWAKPVLRGMGHKCKISQSVGSFNPRVFLSAARKRNSHSLDTGFFPSYRQVRQFLTLPWEYLSWRGEGDTTHSYRQGESLQPRYDALFSKNLAAFSSTLLGLFTDLFFIGYSWFCNCCMHSFSSSFTFSQAVATRC